MLISFQILSLNYYIFFSVILDVRKLNSPGVKYYGDQSVLNKSINFKEFWWFQTLQIVLQITVIDDWKKDSD